MRIVCSICLDDVHENSCLVALSRCGHMFDKSCIDQALVHGRDVCPVCKLSSQGLWGEPQYRRIYPSKSENPDMKECIDLKKRLAEANHKISILQSDLSDTKSTLNLSRQEQNATSSRLKEAKESLENATKSVERLKKDVENLKRAKDDCFKRNDKLKHSNQTLTGNLKKSESLCQTLREQLASMDASSDNQGIQGSTASSSSDSQEGQVPQKDYLDLKKSYQDLVIRERLVEKKLTDLTLKQEGSNYTENLEHTQRIYKQLTEALSNEKRLNILVNQLKHEKKDIVNEKKSLQERFNGAIKDLKRLQETEKLWTTNTLNLQDIIRKEKQNVSDLQNSNQKCNAEISKLKEAVKTLNEHLTASINSRDLLKRTTDTEKVNLQKTIATWKDKATASASRAEILSSTIHQLTNQVNALHLENTNLLKELKETRQPWVSFRFF